MAQAQRDNNGVTTMQGVLNTDGVTPKNVTVDPVTHFIDISDGTTGSDLGSDDATRDNNAIPVLMGTSSADGVTPVPIYVNSSGKLLINSS